jgi:CubicO group peptidase (beta-lactamase class C family)
MRSCSGVARLASKDFVSRAPVDHDTVFEAASVSKTVFAYVVLKLCEKGVLDLDTPLTKYTPDRFLEGDPRLDLITARRVLSHTTGFMTNGDRGFDDVIAKIARSELMQRFVPLTLGA